MKSKIVKLLKRPFVRNVIIISTGTLAAQAITLFLTPVITRLYGPEAYGLMGVFVSLLGIVTPIAALTYPIAIVLPKKEEEAQGIIRLSFYISLITSMVAVLIIIFLSEHIVKLFNIEEIESYLFLIPVAILLAGFSQIMQQWLIRTKQFRITAKTTFVQALVMNSGKVGVGVFYPVAPVLISLSAIAPGFNAFLMYLFLKKSNEKQVFYYNKSISIKKLATNYKDFPLFRAPQVFINAISDNLPVVLLTSFFGPASVGFYSLGRTALSIPTTLIGKSIGDVFYPRISDAGKNGENLTNLIKKTMFLLGIIAVIPFGLIIIFGPGLFSFVFGAEWRGAGEYARWIALWLFFKFIYQPCIIALPVLSAQAFHLKFTIINLMVRLLSLIIGFYVFSDDLMAIALFGISAAILSICLIFITLQISKRFDNRLN
ncbi:oligosaccharide flippase family protein [uncultured Psychrobacillus sp.]|uniref:lipopolysaccharide biosynthesis protein n=1 Tax=uncultured Psychrobacillus sp. TaxID=1551585 RepID=UPI002602790B|nr:oligosaccharide flippase family protein [uncultured Psychrobacillus sp.]